MALSDTETYPIYSNVIVQLYRQENACLVTSRYKLYMHIHIIDIQLAAHLA